MSKKHFIALADTIQRANRDYPEYAFTAYQIKILAAFCQAQNGNFNSTRWLAYIAGECGPNGGAR